MSRGGLSAARLRRLRDVLAGHVELGGVPGLVSLVSRRGEVHVDAIGVQTLAGGPMRRDTLFRIASLSKPITAAAAMILVEECKLRLDDPRRPFVRRLSRARIHTRSNRPDPGSQPEEPEGETTCDSWS